MIRLSKENIIALHRELLTETGGRKGIRDEGLLDSAINAPFQTFDQTELYPSVYHKAARLCFGLVNDHPFIDGNKRIGTHAMLIFLALNGIELEYSDKELCDIIFALASGTLDCKSLMLWIIEHETE